jgi:hypothetical protein
VDIVADNGWRIKQKEIVFSRESTSGVQGGKKRGLRRDFCRSIATIEFQLAQTQEIYQDSLKISILRLSERTNLTVNSHFLRWGGGCSGAN